MHVVQLLGCMQENDYFNDFGSGELEQEVTESPEDSPDYADKKIMSCMKKVDAIKIVEQGDDVSVPFLIGFRASFV
jgi:hypothetical protein